MTRVSWSTCEDSPCLRVGGARAATLVAVRPVSARGVRARPPTAGRLVADGDDLCFVPRFPFLDGTDYEVEVDGAMVGTVTCSARPQTPPTTEVVAIRPTGTTVPRNLLRCYVEFSAPMREAGATRVRLTDAEGWPLVGALLATEYELWDPDRRRLTVLLDPARIKRGLVPQRELGYPLREGASVTLVVDAEFPDAAGRPLRTGATRTWQVIGDERRRVTPSSWALRPGTAGTTEPLTVTFDRPLDHALVARCLRVVGPAGTVGGSIDVGREERSWTFAPTTPWPDAEHRLVVGPELEDVAGNSVQRVFDRDLTNAADDPGDGGPVELVFRPT
ncbi:MAG TPA: hypothetical protein VGN51_04965 [Acidimicrobiia bacterium]